MIADSRRNRKKGEFSQNLNFQNIQFYEIEFFARIISRISCVYPCSLNVYPEKVSVSNPITSVNLPTYQWQPQTFSRITAWKEYGLGYSFGYYLGKKLSWDGQMNSKSRCLLHLLPGILRQGPGWLSELRLNYVQVFDFCLWYKNDHIIAQVLR